jgi:hypothetical protein
MATLPADRARVLGRPTGTRAGDPSEDTCDICRVLVATGIPGLCIFKRIVVGA